MDSLGTLLSVTLARSCGTAWRAICSAPGHAEYLARSPLRAQGTVPISDVRGRRDLQHGNRHRREHGRVQRLQRSAVATVSLYRPRGAGRDLRDEPRAGFGPVHRQPAGLPHVARTRDEPSGIGRLSWMDAEPDRHRPGRAADGTPRQRRLLQPSGRDADCRPNAFRRGRENRGAHRRDQRGAMAPPFRRGPEHCRTRRPAGRRKLYRHRRHFPEPAVSRQRHRSLGAAQPR